jgi:cation transport ATPase
MATGKLNMELLVCMASTASIVMRESATALVVMYLINLSEYLEDKTMEKTRKAIRAMLSGDDQMVWRVADGVEEEVSSSELVKGDLIILRIGSGVPCDETVTDGDALVEEASMTGESLPVYKKAGDAVVAGTHLEGCGKNGERELARFMSIAAGSASEVEYQLLLACDLDYMQDETYGVLSEKRYLKVNG